MFITYGHRTWKRIEFYVKAGLVPRVPSLYQLKQVSESQYSASAIPERIKYYCKHPLEIFPTSQKALAVRQTNQAVAAGSAAMNSDGVRAVDTESVQTNGLPFDRMLRTAFLFSPIRLTAHLIYNPWFMVPGTGLDVPTRYMVAHLAHGPHPFPLWDLQILHADGDGLDCLERELEIRSRGMDLKSTIYRALAQREGYYDFLRELIPRIRNFDYPPVPNGFNSKYENLVLFLNCALTIKNPS